MKKILDFRNKSYSNVSGIYQNMEKPLKHQRRLGLTPLLPPLLPSSQTLYLAQLINDRRQPPFFFFSISLKVTLLLISNMSSGTSSYILFKDISCLHQCVYLFRNRDSSPTRQFTDTHFEDSSPTELKTVHQQN